MAVEVGSNFTGRITAAVVITCIVAATCGLIFGYDIGVSGGVTTMAPFLEKFFPDVLREAAESKMNMYCIFDSHLLTLFTSSLYMAGLIASLMASQLTALVGRKNVMVLGGTLFLVGAAINGGAQNIHMIIVGRLLLGFGVGFTNQAAPVYLSEVAPPKWRGAFNAGFELFLGIGVLAANCVNYVGARRVSGWRLSLGFAAVPAAIMTIGALLIHDTPSSLVARGKLSQARKALIKFRGSNSKVEEELAEIVRSHEAAKATNEEPFKTIFKRQYRPHLVMSIAIPFFQQLTGVSIIAFFAPVVFQSVGLGNEKALLGAILLGIVNLGSITASAFAVDKLGRRFLFMAGGIQMLLCQILIAVILATTVGASGTVPISKNYGVLVVILMCIYSAGFGWSWGPLTWLIPSEIFPMKIRSAGMSITSATQFAVTFVLSQMFLSMLCSFKYGIFLFYAGWIVVMSTFVTLFLPETKGVPIDSMHEVWQQHWFWGRFMKE